MCCSSVPRLVLWICMHMHPNSIGMMGPDCSSWGLPARGSSWRSPINIFGNVFSDWVRRSTSMVSRNLFGKKGESSTCAYFTTFYSGFMHLLFNLGWWLAQDGPCDTSTLGQQLYLGGGAATTKPTGRSQAVQLARQQSHICFYLAIVYEISNSVIPFV